MTKIRCGDDLGVDINHVIGWKIFTPDKTRGKTIALFLLAAGDTLHVSENFVGSQAFTNLHRLLLERFPIDLKVSDSLPSTTYSD